MAASYVQLPDDSLNTGKKVRTNTRTVGPDTVHEHFWIIQDITDDRQARVLDTDAAGSDAGLVVRNIPGSTTQNVDVVGGNVGFAVDTDQPTHSTASVGTTNTTVVGAPAGGNTRKYIMVQNISDTTVWIKLDGSAAVVNEGVEILSKGVYEVITPMPISQTAVTGIHNSSGSKTVLVQVVDAP